MDKENEIPEVLLGALRQYRRNSEEEFIAGFDRDETIRVVRKLQTLRRIAEENEQLVRDAHVGKHMPRRELLEYERAFKENTYLRQRVKWLEEIIGVEHE